MKIIIGADHGGFQLKGTIVTVLRQRGLDVVDIGTDSAESVDYPVYAFRVARAVAAGEADRGILVCGSGIGMCMTANRVPGVRAVSAFEPYGARLSRRHNDSNVLCLGERITGSDLALSIVEDWIDAPFEGGRHQRRVDLIDSL
ncbi:MAG: ribose 5-phosphate isomerase B [Syntrophobacteraceae bacterium]